jgi:ketosteroid isomerase-like protein
MSEPAEPTSAIEQVLRAEREWLLAHLRLDVQALDRLMAPEYVQIDDRGRTVGKEQVLESFRSGARGWDEAHSDDHDVRIYGNTAFVIGRWRARGVNAGQPFDYAAR